ncbi:inositol monophosphatase [Pseudooceanicola sp. GBMRC 2024]|uniref:Inositol monophosphatase n=2 Tax=Paracoccaceae TaxID=31989 RepID=A0A6L7FYR5_9RHOB|nr:inositol monophosphatase [Pseudooceanicola albus]
MPRAAARALEGFRNREAGQYTLKGPQDILTETDLAVEALIRAEIARAFPEDAILGEEGGGTPGPATWVIDPIDGTANFARGIPHFCVIVAFCLDGRCELGAICEPVGAEHYLARRGCGATLNGTPMQVSPTREMPRAALEFGWSRRHPVAQYLEAQRQLLELGATLRRGASGGLALAYVAAGRSDGYAELSMNSWDCLAGLLMVHEAGGTTGPWPATLDDLSRTGPVLAATPALAEAFSGAVFGPQLPKPAAPAPL